MRRILPGGLRGEIIAVVLAASLTSLLMYVGFDLLFPPAPAAFAVGLPTTVAAS